MWGRSVLPRALSLVALSAAGLVGGHALGYALVVPDPLHRSALLSGTGHGYMPSLPWTLVVCGVAALVTGLSAGYVHRGSPSRGAFRLARPLVVAQAGAFVVIELVERIWSGASLGTLSASLLVVGVLVQLLVAVVAALVLVGLHKAGAILRGRPRVTPAQSACSRLPHVHPRADGASFCAARRVRAPPAFVS